MAKNKKQQYLYFFPLHRPYIPTKRKIDQTSHWQSMWEGMLDENGKPRK